jgi:DNA-binding transcriptional regulator PaaX
LSPEQKLLLNAIKLAGVLAVALVVPNILGAMQRLGMVPGKRHKASLGRSLERLVENGLVIRSEKGYSLTRAGERRMSQFVFEDFAIRRARLWDERWRVVVFDIPEKRRKLRVRLREILMLAGFLRLQDSVWIHPYDCEDLLTLLKTELGIGKHLVYMVVESIENDRDLRSHFSLR